MSDDRAPETESSLREYKSALRRLSEVVRRALKDGSGDPAWKVWLKALDITDESPKGRIKALRLILSLEDLVVAAREEIEALGFADQDSKPSLQAVDAIEQLVQQSVDCVKWTNIRGLVHPLHHLTFLTTTAAAYERGVELGRYDEADIHQILNDVEELTKLVMDSALPAPWMRMTLECLEDVRFAAQTFQVGREHFTRAVSDIVGTVVLSKKAGFETPSDLTTKLSKWLQIVANTHVAWKMLGELKEFLLASSEG